MNYFDHVKSEPKMKYIKSACEDYLQDFCGINIDNVLDVQYLFSFV